MVDKQLSWHSSNWSRQIQKTPQKQRVEGGGNVQDFWKARAPRVLNSLGPSQISSCYP